MKYPKITKMVFATLVTILAAVFLVSAVRSNPPLVLIIDGQEVGTMELLRYELDTGTINITTYEGVYGCQQLQIFEDRFEGDTP